MSAAPGCDFVIIGRMIEVPQEGVKPPIGALYFNRWPPPNPAFAPQPSPVLSTPTTPTNAARSPPRFSNPPRHRHSPPTLSPASSPTPAGSAPAPSPAKPSPLSPNT